jgi:hypothetical protein
MGINTDLTVDPYYDDFDEAKQFNRVLFKPAKAVQARELTQLQTILQKQVERFGSNVYKEGTIISGINLTARDDLFYVKLNDQSAFPDPSIYDQIVNDDGTTTTFTVTGQTSQLKAEVIKGVGGFQTQFPDLKTFFIKYLNTQIANDNQSDVKQFIGGELLEIRNADDELIQTVTVNNDVGNTGQSFGVSCEEGVIYQKGHFIFVDQQFIVVEKYSNSPGTKSVGFTIKENIVDSDADSTLLDNASGFNNENAPGADRLQLVPTLVSYDTATEPTEFFALIRYVDGLPVRIRDVTEFNTINKELSRRTYEESGNYVTNGLKLSLEKDGNNAFVSVSPGKAYVFGNEVTNVSTTKLQIDPPVSTQSKTEQRTGVTYGQYFLIDFDNDDDCEPFLLDGTRYPLKDNNDATIGHCSVANVTPGKLFVYAIKKDRANNKEGEVVYKVNNTPVKLNPDTNGDGIGDNPAYAIGPYPIQEPALGSMIFDIGKSSMNTVSNVDIVKRVRLTGVTLGGGQLSNDQLQISATGTTKPLVGDIFGLDASSNVVLATASTYSGDNIIVTFAANDVTTVYYNELVTNVAEDTLDEKVGYVKTVYQAPAGGRPGFGLLGVPNCIEILEVKDSFGGQNANDVTSKFRLVNNQNDGFYDTSYISLYAGEVLENNNIIVKFRYLDRTSTVGGGYLSVDSYSNVGDKTYLVQNYTSKALVEFNLFNSYDFRPYVNQLQIPSLSASGAPTVNSASQAITISRGITPALNTTISADQTYFMSRMDAIVLDEYSNIQLVKGGESENPSMPDTSGLYAIGKIRVPGNVNNITGEDKIELANTSTSNFTMEDIGRINSKIDSLIDIVSLSLLENETSNIDIRDANGRNRFKNGILADSMRDLNIADIRDPEFRAAIDKGRTTATPAVNQFPVDLKFGSGVGVTEHKDIVTLAGTGTFYPVIEQKYATSFRNCVSNFYSYDGKAIIDPPFSSGYDVVKNPEVNIEIDIAGPMLDLVDNLQEIMPLTSEELLSEERVGTTRPRRRVIMGQFEQTIEERSLESSQSSLNQAVGNFVTDVNMKPYLRRQEVKVLVTGLRPNTRHYFFFDQKSIDAHVAPGTKIDYQSNNSSSLDVSKVSANWHNSKNAAVRTDANGVLSAVFMIPAETFFVGQNVLEIVDVDQYSSIDSASTSYARATYRGYNFELNKTDLSVTTRSVDFDTNINIIQREVERQVGDPIAQTFRVKPSSTNGANAVFVRNIEVYFKKVSPVAGVTLQIREVINGYPSKRVLPFASKHLNPGVPQVSENGITPTVFQFDNPIKLLANKEYAFVVIPDANNPDYLIYTSKVGATSLSKGTTAVSTPVTNDWGDGVLFTSTNDSAWKSYQDEDIKFIINRYDFGTTGHVDLVPNDMEFLKIRDNVNEFLIDELAYVRKSQNYSASVSGDNLNIVTITGSTVFSVGEYMYLTDPNGQDTVAKILDLDDSTSNTVMTIDKPFYEATASATAYVCVAGKVSHFNRRKADALHLKGSSAKSSNFIDDNAPTTIGSLIPLETYTITEVGTTTTKEHWVAVGAGDYPNLSDYLGITFQATAAGTAGDGTARQNSQVIRGVDSGATAVITQVTNEKVSYFQPQVFVHNGIDSSTDLKLYNGNVLDKGIQRGQNVYTINSLRTVASKSRIENTADSTTQGFKIRVDMSNNAKNTVTPLVDRELSEVNTYQYYIGNSVTNSSQWVSKEVVLKEGLNAVGMKVLMAAYRPAGTFVDVYVRFVYPENIEEKSGWILLDNASPDLYSNTSNTKDYRQFEYNLDEDTYTDDYSSFQLKFVLRHGTTGSSGELNTPELNSIVPDVNLFPHIYDYRAIALT